MQNKKHQQMLQHNKTAAPNDLPPLYPGQDVRVFDKTSKTWSPATVITRCPEPRSYTVQTNNGTTVRRNRVHCVNALKRTKLNKNANHWKATRENYHHPGHTNNTPVQRHHWQNNGNINKIQYQSVTIITAQQEMAKQQPGQAGLSENAALF